MIDSYWFIDNIEVVVTIVVALISGAFGLFKFFSNKKKEQEVKPPVITQNFYDKKSDVKVEKLSMDEIKRLTTVLFIDDDKQFKSIVQILKSAGWRNSSLFPTADVRDLDDNRIKGANIIFIDIKGVGKTMFGQEEGMGLAEALKNKYPDKKVVLYSAVPEHHLTHPAVKKVDDIIDKNAQTMEFVSLIEELAKRIEWKN